MFPTSLGQPFTGLSYTAGPGASTHIITGLQPDTGYSVTRSGASVSVQPGGSQMTDSGGVLVVQ